MVQLPAVQDELYQLTATINKMLADIKQNDEVQQNFFAAAAHELRTPVAVLKTGAEVNLQNPNMPPLAKEFIHQQLDELNSVARLLEDFLVISKNNKGFAVANYSNINIARLIQNCLVKLKPIIVEYGVNITFTDTENIGTAIVSDENMLEHIVINLCENAIKYAAVGSTVLIAVMYNNGRNTLTVKNRTVEEQGDTQILLKPFYQGNPFKRGNGLGLWISSQLSQAIGATMAIAWHNYEFTAAIELQPINHL
jgi:signal transduction histidine kinase